MKKKIFESFLGRLSFPCDIYRLTHVCVCATNFMSFTSVIVYGVGRTTPKYSTKECKLIVNERKIPNPKRWSCGVRQSDQLLNPVWPIFCRSPAQSRQSAKMVSVFFSPLAHGSMCVFLQRKTTQSTECSVYFGYAIKSSPINI